VAGALLVAALALLTEVVLSLLSWALSPRTGRRHLPWSRVSGAERELVPTPL
jgi:hypothetical protein